MTPLRSKYYMNPIESTKENASNCNQLLFDNHLWCMQTVGKDHPMPHFLGISWIWTSTTLSVTRIPTPPRRERSAGQYWWMISCATRIPMVMTIHRCVLFLLLTMDVVDCPVLTWAVAVIRWNATAPPTPSIWHMGSTLRLSGFL